MFVLGHTESADFPTTAGAFDTVFNGNSDIYVVELDTSGSTKSSDLPISAGDFDTSFNGGDSDVFVAKFGFAGEEMGTPEMVADLQIRLCGNDLLLLWSPVTIDTSGSPSAIDFYYIHRDTIASPFYGYNPFDSTVSSSYLDTSGGWAKRRATIFMQ